MVQPGTLNETVGGVSRTEAEHQAFVDRKRIARMARVDALPDDLRALVHEYGLNTVQQFVQSGIGKPQVIRHLVETVLDEFSPTRGTFSGQGVRNPLLKGGQR